MTSKILLSMRQRWQHWPRSDEGGGGGAANAFGYVASFELQLSHHDARASLRDDGVTFDVKATATNRDATDFDMSVMRQSSGAWVGEGEGECLYTDSEVSVLLDDLLGKYVNRQMLGD